VAAVQQTNDVAAVAIGVGVVDAIFRGDANDPTYYGATGGGTVWNIAAGVAAAGGVVLAVGTVGNDWRGNVASTSLASAGVQVDFRWQKERVTRVTCQLPIAEQGECSNKSARYQFHSDGPVCMRPAPRSRRATMVAPRLPPGPGFLLADRISELRLQAARRAHNNGWETLLDIGRADLIHRTPKSKLREALTDYDIVVMPSDVSLAVRSKLDVPSIEALGTTGLLDY
jgi:sugar/nucleoside kinase (ribokinase family)